MAKDVADSAVQVLGGYGYVADYQVHICMPRALKVQLSSACGGHMPAHHAVGCELDVQPAKATTCSLDPLMSV